MNTKQLKNYGPQARREFIAAVTDRASLYGLTTAGIAPVTQQGDVAIIGGKAYPKAVAGLRDRLAERIQAHGFEQTMEAIAYTWFNRLVAIRFMELHGYFDHGYRVLSHPESQGRPEILDHAADVDLPGLDRERAVELKLDGTQDEELYRLLLLAQCNALHEAMPFLFERIGDETELLLPANLLHTNSLVRQLVEQVDEGLWAEIEIIGWLYQFYISEKKDQVIGKVVKSEDIPAATQLFTPNWIVKYMVQNSLGAQWLATYPHSPLRGQMEYYIEPAEQTDEVKAQLAAITPRTLNPEELTLIDPASGSGHILVEAYKLFKAIYLERGYRQRDVPQLILEKNLFGIDIDERAAQLTGFALMMKGRADDRRLFERGAKLNVMALVDSAEFYAERLAQGLKLVDYGLQLSDLTELKRLFEYATTFGSLIQVSGDLAKKLPQLKKLSEATSHDLFLSDALKRLEPLVRQAELLATRYDAVVANPPYMGSKGMNSLVKAFVEDHFANAKGDLFSCFIERSYTLAQRGSHNSMVTIQGWMFLSTFELMRKRFLRSQTPRSLIHIGFNSFPTLNSKVALAASFAFSNVSIDGFIATFIDLNSAGKSEDKAAVFARRRLSHRHQLPAERFERIPGSPMAYWASAGVYRVFGDCRRLSDVAEANQGLATADNDRFLRLWPEISLDKCGFGSTDRDDALRSGKKWFPFNKGGPIRKWYGNCDFVVNWENDGEEIRRFGTEKGGRQRSRPQNARFYFRPSVSWSDVTFTNSFREYPVGFIHGNVGHSAFGGDRQWRQSLLAYCNNKFVDLVTKLLSPSMHFDVGYFGQIPYAESVWNCETAQISATCVSLSKTDWNVYERSWDFQSLSLLTVSSDPVPTLESRYTAWITQNRETIAEMKRLEEENNRLFIDAYGLADELTPDIPIEQITLTVNPAYRYGGKLSEDEQWTRFRQDTVQELVSYAIGCMMGRYSLDAPGLIYAHSGNGGFDPSRYPTFPADDDGVIPLTDMAWFDDDATHRLVEFLSVAWDERHLEENLTFLSENLSPKRGESSRDTIRRYLATRFFKDHLKTYKKRPIYWLFSSGKQRAFQGLVYLHRYHEGTLGRMRTEYVIPLQGKMTSRIQQLEGDIAEATSTSHRRKLEKERDTLSKQRLELQAFDEKLRHYADQRIHLDLDDGVKINYGKFGDLLAEVKAVTGKKPG